MVKVKFEFEADDEHDLRLFQRSRDMQRALLQAYNLARHTLKYTDLTMPYTVEVALENIMRETEFILELK